MLFPRFSGANLLKTAIYAVFTVLIFAPGDDIFTEFSANFHASRTGQAVAGFFVFAAIIIAFLPFFLQKTSFVKRVFYVFVASCLSVVWAFRLIRRSGFSADDANLLLKEAAFAGDTTSAFLPLFFCAMLIASAFITLLWFAPTWLRVRDFSFKKIFFLPLLAIFSIGLYIIFSPTAAAIRYFPSFVKVPAAFASALFKTPESTFRAAPDITFKNAPFAQHIVLIIDESIRADELSRTSPFLKSIENSFLNFGEMSSATNCSATANLILRTGLQPEEIPDEAAISLQKPDIFGYAKSAGFTTFYIDGQSENGALPNYMAQSDLKNIDNYNPIRTKKPLLKAEMIDMEIAAEIARISRSHYKTFTIVNKYGAHFHYENSYPASQKFLKPTLERGESYSDKAKLLNSYRNALRWSVDEFFKKLLPRIDREKTIIFYTSDHGESLMDDGATTAHCQLNATPREQASVPFFIFSPQPDVFKNALKNQNQLSHFEIFGTILMTFGFEKSEVHAKYGATIFEDFTNRQRVFFSGDIFGRSPLRKNSF